MPHISVVVPVYNEEAATLSEFVLQLKIALAAITDDFELILVDDGSQNDAWVSIVSLSRADRRVMGIRFSRNFGQHAAIAAGIDHANGDWVVVMDSDLQDRPVVISDLYRRANEGFDIVFVGPTNRPESVLYSWTPSRQLLDHYPRGRGRLSSRSRSGLFLSSNARLARFSPRDHLCLPWRTLCGSWTLYNHGASGSRAARDCRPQYTASFSRDCLRRRDDLRELCHGRLHRPRQALRSGLPGIGVGERDVGRSFRGRRDQHYAGPCRPLHRRAVRANKGTTNLCYPSTGRPNVRRGASRGRPPRSGAG